MSKVPAVHNMLNTIQQCLGKFFKFSVSIANVKVCIAEIHSNNGKTKQKVKQTANPLSVTRWVERQTAFDDFVSLYEAVTFCLDKTE